MDEIAMVQGDGEQGHDSVADGYALQYCPYSQVGKV